MVLFLRFRLLPLTLPPRPRSRRAWRLRRHSAAAAKPSLCSAEQADLSGAANLPTKLEKGQYVYNALRAVAERTQAPMRKMLQERGIPFQSFYGVNMIKVTASRDLLYELAGHDEVQRIDANPKVQSSIPSPNLHSTRSASTCMTQSIHPGRRTN